MLEKKDMRMRLWIGIDIPEGHAGKTLVLRRVQKILQDSIVDFKPTNHLHSTLLFIGSIEATDLEKIIHVLQEAWQHFLSIQAKQNLEKPIKAYLENKITLFGSAIVICIHPHRSLLLLHELLQETLKSHQIPFAKYDSFIAHVTLGRSASIKIQDVEHISISLQDNETNAFYVSSFVLYESVSGIYYQRARYPL